MRAGEAAAVDVVSAALDRAAADELNAFTRLDPDGAAARAAAIDAAVAEGADPGPLAGVPVALKDLVDQTGIPTTAGSSFLREPADGDATIVTRLEAAGAVIIGRTGLHEFAYGFSSENDWFGPVRNPWDPTCSPGGSSGGSATAVGAGIVPLGIGTDTGGSVRVPAALCGVIGLKVTHGRIPLTGVFPLAASLDTVGPLTRTVEDASAAFAAMAGHDPADAWSVDRPLPTEPAADLRGLRVVIPHPWVDRPIAPEQAEGLGAAREALEEAGAIVADADVPGIDQRDLADHPGLYHEVADVHREWFTADPERYGPVIRDRLRPVLDLSSSDVENALGFREEIGRRFAEVFSDHDVILTPSTAARAKPIGQDLLDVGGGPEPYRPVLSWFTPLVNQAGLPALALPIETGRVEGLPPSVQLIGPAWSERLLLGIGQQLEAAGAVARRRP